MIEHEERRVGALRIQIDATLCVSFGDCVEAAPNAFRLDDEGLVAFVDPDQVEPGTLISACESCPVDAITVWDAAGRQIVP